MSDHIKAYDIGFIVVLKHKVIVQILVSWLGLWHAKVSLFKHLQITNDNQL